VEISQNFVAFSEYMNFNKWRISSLEVRLSPKKVNNKSFNIRGVINGKAGKAADIIKFSDTLTLTQPGGGS
jgi:hypothetical protein